MRSFQQFLDGNLYYHRFQPIFNINTLSVLGCESLLRSKHIESTELLFQKARDLNALYDLDIHSIRTAVQTFSKNQTKRPLEAHLFLNIYPSTLVSSNFLRMFFKIIRRCPISPNQLVLEINEAENIIDYCTLKEVLVRLQAFGIQIALDDFDKGFAPLKRVLEIEPNFIKVDKYFSENLAQSNRKQKMLALLIDYCSSSNIKLILEGIETEDDLSVARSLGVNFGQGFMLGKPSNINVLFHGGDLNA